MADGLALALFIIKPKYLNSETFSIDYSSTKNVAFILICMALVFLTLILSPFAEQNLINTFNRNYKPSGVGDTSTASSANARRNIYKVAISNIKRFLCATLCFSKYCNRSGYTWSKNIQNSLGDAPSPYFSPLLALNLCLAYPLIQTTPSLLTYIFLII